jgi:methylmalonyl-CoA mutase cobalamin-binding domain/chain
VQALAAALGGTQSLHTNAYDEALALRTERSSRLALRTQQMLAHETDVTSTVDPLAGSYAIESLTDAIEEQAQAYLDHLDALGGAVAAIDEGYQKGEIERAAYALARRIDVGERVVVGVNRYQTDGEVAPDLQARLRELGVEVQKISTIPDDIEQGMAGHAHRRIVDRLAAIHTALDEGRAGDTILLAGKGHEQIVTCLRNFPNHNAAVDPGRKKLILFLQIFEPIPKVVIQRIPLVRRGDIKRCVIT